MKSFISSFATSLLLGITSFASAEQTSNFTSSPKQATVLPSEVTVNEFTNEIDPLTAGQSITVVNHSNRRACITTIGANPVVARGWYIIENGAQSTFNGLNYFRAEECGTGGAVYWNLAWDTQYFCLKYGPAFNIYTPGNSSMCQNLGGVMKPHYRLPGSVTLTLLY